MEYQDQIQTGKLGEDFSLMTIPRALSSCQINTLIILSNCRDNYFNQPECLEDRSKGILSHSLITSVSGKYLFMFCCNMWVCSLYTHKSKISLIL